MEVERKLGKGNPRTGLEAKFEDYLRIDHIWVDSYHRGMETVSINVDARIMQKNSSIQNPLRY